MHIVRTFFFFCDLLLNVYIVFLYISMCPQSPPMIYLSVLFVPEHISLSLDHCRNRRRAAMDRRVLRVAPGPPLASASSDWVVDW